MYLWLSFPLSTEGPRPPAIPAPEVHPFYTIEKDGAAVQLLQVASHTGTHLDAPAHVIPGGLWITDFSPEELIYTRPVVVDLPLDEAAIVEPAHLMPFESRLAQADIALFRFGYGSLRREDPRRFSSRSPGFGIAGAQWLRDACPDLRAMGLDVPSLACIESLDDTMQSHHVLLGGKGRRFLVIEDMNLDGDLAGLREVRVQPWLVQQMDSGPCTVVGVLVDARE